MLDRHRIRRVEFWGCCALIVVLAGMLMPSLAEASTIRFRSIEQMAQQADAVARGRVVATSAHWNRGTIVTQVRIEVRERWHGDPPKRVTLEVPGGRIGRVQAHVAGAAHYRVNDDVVLFMERGRDGSWHSLALSWAVYHCHDETAVRATHGLTAAFMTRNPLLAAARSQAALTENALPIARLRARVLLATAP